LCPRRGVGGGRGDGPDGRALGGALESFWESVGNCGKPVRALGICGTFWESVGNSQYIKYFIG